MKAACVQMCLVVLGIQSSQALSPLTRVVDLLKGLSDKIEVEGKAEYTMYKKFVCWAESNVAAKTASNEAATSRADSLKQYIADIEAGRIEFTTERTDLEKEIAQLSTDLETAASLRAKETADFESAKSEMNQGINALNEGIKVLKEATGGAADGSMLAMKGQLRAGWAARVAEGAALSHAADLGVNSGFLSKGDAHFLRRVLTGDVPVPDWKKLNRKATFKKSYQARSGDIQTTLAKLLQTFETNLAEATAKEQSAQALYDKLAAAKGDQKAKAEDALLKMEQEMGARGMSKADSQAEVEELEKQVTDDTAYISQVQSTLETKKGEWTVRDQLRTAELAAISKAISTIHSDDARDVFKKSLDSQGFSFMQLQNRAEVVRGKVVEELNKVAAQTGDKRVQALVAAATQGNFDAVIQAIDTMVAMMKTEETQDLKQKEQCETDRAEDTRSAVVTSRTIDELTDTMTRLKSEIEELTSQIDQSNKEITQIEEQLEEAKRLREDAAAAYATSKKDDESAKALVEQARSILTTFYAENNLMLLAHKQKQGQAPVSAAGEAPPPPPTTWEAPYGGKSGEATGIISILTMIADDLQKDMDKATSSEQASIQDYLKMKGEQEESVSDLQTLIGTLQGQVAAKEGDITTAEGDKSLQKEQLEALFKKMKDMEPGCDFIAGNFNVRSTNRQI